MSESVVRLPGKHVIIHAGGSCLGNPGSGGWAVLLQLMEGPKEIRRKGWRGSFPEATNNLMELTAAIKGLKKIRSDSPVVVRSNSQYVVDGAVRRLADWKANGWRTGKKKAVANRGLWEELDRLAAGRSVTWERVTDSGDRIILEVHQQAREAARGASVKGSAGRPP
jgi:ribonuclease HI